MPRSEKFDGYEVVHVDGQSFRRDMPKLETKKVGGKSIGELVMERGANDIESRLRDLDEEGVWAEVVYDSLGLWESMIKDQLLRAANRAQNEWKATEIVRRRTIGSCRLPRSRCSTSTSPFRSCSTPHRSGSRCQPADGVPDGSPDYNRDDWEPLWAAAEEAGMVLGFHIGSDNDGKSNTPFRGPGGAVLNYVEHDVWRSVRRDEACDRGALDRHPSLKVLISEGGATWVPFVGDRMNEGYRQHHMFVRPVLSVLPKEILYRQVYTSFQHDETAPAALWAMGYHNVLWGSDYPHLEGTFGHTQKTLHELFDDVDPDVSYRIRLGAFKELFPHVSDPPTVA